MQPLPPPRRSRIPAARGEGRNPLPRDPRRPAAGRVGRSGGGGRSSGGRCGCRRPQPVRRVGAEAGRGRAAPGPWRPLCTAVGRGGGKGREPGPRQVMKARAMGGSEAAVRAASWSRLSGEGGREGGRQEGELPCSSAFLPRSRLSPPRPPLPPTPPASSLPSIPTGLFFSLLFYVTFSPHFFPSSPPPYTHPPVLSVLHQKFEQLSILLLPFTFKCCVILN